MSYYRIYPTSETVPKFYGLPKVHKNNVPLRPIVSSIGSITYKTAKFLASILSPLVGKTEHFVKNSIQFVKKIKELEVPPGRKMVSFDVTALFTSIPVTEAVSVIKDRLNQDTTLKDRCELSVNQIITLLEICLNTTYLIYDGVFYKQKKGAAMGSPVSPIVANLYMEHFEERAITEAPHPPDIWLRYVDDTFTVLQESEVEHFTHHLNSMNENIKYTVEPEQDNTLAFLDTCVCLNDDGSTKVKIYRKATHTDQYLNWDSNRHLEHKRSVVRTLLQRTENLITKEEDKNTEVDHIKKVLKANGYKTWMFNTTQPMRRKENTTIETSRRQHAIGLPYISKLSEQVARIFKSYNIPVYHKLINTLRSLLVHPKDRTAKAAKCGVVYDIQCPECDQHYIGETARTLGTRIKEHLSCHQPLSAISEHKLNTGHQCSMKDVNILDHEENWHRRKIKEVINIHRKKPTLNRDVVQELPPVLLQLVSHDIGHVTHP